jgi:hypothetical protein
LSGKLGGKSQERQMRASWWKNRGEQRVETAVRGRRKTFQPAKGGFYENIEITMRNARYRAWNTLSGGRQLEDAEADDEEGGWVSVWCCRRVCLLSGVEWGMREGQAQTARRTPRAALSTAMILLLDKK